MHATVRSHQMRFARLVYIRSLCEGASRVRRNTFRATSTAQFEPFGAFDASQHIRPATKDNRWREFDASDAFGVNAPLG